jgi:tellurite resistance-related uncharacterized protein
MISYPKDQPLELAMRRRTPSFAEETVPTALLKEHLTKAGAWGVLHVEAGRLRYHVPSEEREIGIPRGETVVIRPEKPHHVSAVGSMSFYFEFWGEETA